MLSVIKTVVHITNYINKRERLLPFLSLIPLRAVYHFVFCLLAENRVNEMFMPVLPYPSTT